MNKIAAKVILFLLTGAAVLRAEQEIYFAEDRSPWRPVGNGGPNPVPKPTNLMTTFQKAAEFYSRLPGVLTETFESYTNGTPISTLTFGTNTATLSGSHFIYSYSSPTSAIDGGFAFSGTNVIGLDGGRGLFFTLSFSTPQSAFGFLGCDVEYNKLQLTFVYPDGARQTNAVPVEIPQGSGGAFFYGVIDRARPFVSVEFENVGDSPDGFVFDDMTIAVPEQVLPAPAYLQIGMSDGMQAYGLLALLGPRIALSSRPHSKCRIGTQSAMSCCWLRPTCCSMSPQPTHRGGFTEQSELSDDAAV